MRVAKLICFCTFIYLMYNQKKADGILLKETQEMINEANSKGPYFGLIIPNLFEMEPLLQSPSYKSSSLIIEFSGRRFRFGTIAEMEVILVMTGLGVINAGITTQLLLTLFNMEGVLHYGTAGNANPLLNVGDVTIPQFWSHTGLWNWQRYGDGIENVLSLEKEGDYTREIGYIRFADYASNVTNCIHHDNTLNNIWYQPEEVFPIDGAPEERQHVFWVPVDPLYFDISRKLEGLELERCVNSSTCLSKTPKVATVLRGASANIFLSNAAYRSFLFDKFNVTPIDMETSSVALICFQQRVPFIAFRALSGGASAQSTDASKFLSLAAKNSVAAMVEFLKQLSASRSKRGKLCSFK